MARAERAVCAGVRSIRKSRCRHSQQGRDDAHCSVIVEVTDQRRLNLIDQFPERSLPDPIDALPLPVFCISSDCPIAGLVRMIHRNLRKSRSNFLRHFAKRGHRSPGHTLRRTNANLNVPTDFVIGLAAGKLSA